MAKRSLHESPEPKNQNGFSKHQVPKSKPKNESKSVPNPSTSTKNEDTIVPQTINEENIDQETPDIDSEQILSTVFSKSINELKEIDNMNKSLIYKLQTQINNTNEELMRSSVVSKGGQFLNHPIFFSDDQNYFCIATHHSLSMYHVQNSRYIGEIPFKGEGGSSITRIIHTTDKVSKRPAFVFVYSFGTIYIYDAVLLTHIRKTQISPRHKIVSKNAIDNILYYATKNPGENQTKSFSIHKFDFGSTDSLPLKKGSKELVNKVESNKLPKHKTKKIAESIIDIEDGCTQLEITPDGEHLVVMSDSHVYTIDIKTKTLINRIDFYATLVSMAINPKSNSEISVGDENGIIHFCQRVFDPNTKPIKSSVHWHSSSVNALEYTKDGNYLLSGGIEAVLVFWQLSTLKRDFLPRLGGKIAAIRVSGKDNLIGLTLLNNSVSVIEFETKKPISLVSGLQCNESTPSIAINPNSPLITTTGIPGMLQNYDLVNDKHINNLEVVSYNRISTNTKLAVPEITHYGYSNNGTWLLTAEKKQIGGLSICTLKFWIEDSYGKSFNLNTKINMPHMTNPVVDVAIHSSESKTASATCVTCDENSIKLWRFIISADGGSWQNVKQTLQLFRSKTDSIKRISFSNDGSVLLVSTNQEKLYFIDIFTMEQLSDPVYVPSNASKLHEFFFAGKNSEYILFCSDKSLQIMDSVSFNIRFHLALPKNFDFIRCCVSQSKFSVVLKHDTTDDSPTENTKYIVLTFTIDQIVSLISWCPIGFIGNPQIVGFEFFSRKLHSDSLILVDSASNYKIISVEPNTDLNSHKNLQQLSKDLEPTNENKIFDSIFGSSTTNSIDTKKETKVVGATNTWAQSDNVQIHKLYQFVPSHQIPNVYALFDASLQSLLSNNMENTQSKNTESNIDEKEMDNSLQNGDQELENENENGITNENGEQANSVGDASARNLVSNSADALNILQGIFSIRL
ncbi:hypothetical protein BB558_005266 [Smittium angustum]|uniref:WD repeat-containing protein 75 second beta-propeller domain-containing protein n=1 Tax=Smittium angustum TaxID=133377 RepID=A0A2U1IZ90_SMIAN|nr:hypothetical protein BB558_005860 [Smittium angustum]PVZ98720.1 hypothetical protein BB558_005266 [Smittium angustum]